MLWFVLLSGGCSAATSSTPQGSSVASATSVTPSPTAAVTPGPFGVEDLPGIVITADTVPPGMTVDDELSGGTALEQPVALLPANAFTQLPGFVDARMTRVGTSGPGSYWEEGGYVTWAALYQTPASAAAAFAVLVDEHRSGWDMDIVGNPPFGDEGVTLKGPAYGFDTRLHVWRADNLLLAAAGLGPKTTEADLQAIADGVHTRSGHLDLDDIIISPDSPPQGMTFSSQEQGRDVLSRLPLYLDTSAALLAKPDFVDGQSASFAGNAGFILTWVAQYESAEAASETFEILRNELESEDRYGWGIGQEAGLGDEGTCLEGDNPRLGGLHETICLWRHGPLVLVAGGDTSEPLKSFANAMEARVDGIIL